MAQNTADNPTLQDSGFNNHQLKIMRPPGDPSKKSLILEVKKAIAAQGKCYRLDNKFKQSKSSWHIAI